MRVVAINWDMRVVAINWDMFGRIKRNAIPKNNFKNLRTVQIDDGKVKNKEKKMNNRGREQLGHTWATKSDT